MSKRIVPIPNQFKAHAIYDQDEGVCFRQLVADPPYPEVIALGDLLEMVMEEPFGASPFSYYEDAIHLWEVTVNGDSIIIRLKDK